MSELFKALQKLEEQNGPEVPQAFSPSGGNRKSKNSPPYLKSVLLCVLLLVLTIVCLEFIWFAKDSFTSSSTVPENDAEVEKKQSIPVVDPFSVTPENTILSEPKPVSQALFSPTENPLPPMEESTDHFKTKVENIDAVTQEITPKIQSKKAVIEQLVGATNDMEREQNRNRKKKRILYQAEKMRKQGDLSKALILYKKIWAFGPNPDIANNLAAILIQSKQYEEAEDYLKQAIPLAPDDEDLQFNLKIAQECKKRKK